MTLPFEVGQPVTINDDNYLNTLPGMILDVSSSSDPAEIMYTVEVEDHGTHYFYGFNLASTEGDIVE